MPSLATPPCELTLATAVARARSLATLPAVAVEVLRLTDQPKTDVRALRDCIATDPALTAKLLRVVNSSMFGVSREVSDLNQALALLGIKPLKLLVLGFSLPAQLLQSAAQPQLEWYWRTALARAAAAREIGRRYEPGSEDVAFLAGLLADVGVLALFAQLGSPYAELVEQATAADRDLTDLERRSLGFDHRELTAALLEAWRMPANLVEAIRAPHVCRQWARNRAAHAPVVRAIHLADLLGELVGRHRLNVLPELLAVGAEYYGLDQPALHDMVANLEGQVRQLATALHLEEGSPIDYAATIEEAHRRLALLAEEEAARLEERLAHADRPPHRPPDVAPAATVEPAATLDLDDLARQMQRAFARGGHAEKDGEDAEPLAVAASRSTTSASFAAAAAPSSSADRQDGWRLQFADPTRDDFSVRLTLAVGESRAARSSLSLVLVGLRPEHAGDPDQVRQLEEMLDAACRAVDLPDARWHPPQRGRRALLLPGADRVEAVAVARAVASRLATLAESARQREEIPRSRAAAGVSTVTAPARNFEATLLIDAAQRCLEAALTGGGVKSLEVS